jgi:hypothetical protein
MWILATSGLTGVGDGDGDGLGDGVDVGVTVGVGLGAAAAVTWMNGLRLVNWSRFGTCWAGSGASRLLPVEAAKVEVEVEVSAKPTAAGFAAFASPLWPCTATTEATAIDTITTITSTAFDLLIVIVVHLPGFAFVLPSGCRHVACHALESGRGGREVTARGASPEPSA